MSQYSSLTDIELLDRLDLASDLTDLEIELSFRLRRAHDELTGVHDEPTIEGDDE